MIKLTNAACHRIARESATIYQTIYNRLVTNTVKVEAKTTCEQNVETRKSPIERYLRLGRAATALLVLSLVYSTPASAWWLMWRGGW